jgi:signal transduction histidine kinase
MQERASLVGATLQIESAPGEGTTLFIRMPTSPVPAPTLAPDGYGVAREHA